MPVFRLTGALGFEPRDGETKTRCLTTWRRPNNFTMLNITLSPGLMSSTLIVDSDNRFLQPDIDWWESLHFASFITFR